MRSLLALLLLSLAVAPLEAQTGSIVGRVLTDSATTPVVGAEVLLVDRGRSTVTGAGGAFRLDGVQPGAVLLVVRRLGFRPASRSITLAPGQSAQVELALVPAAGVQRLPTLEVEAERSAARARLRAGSGGTFLSRATLDSAHGRTVAQLLRERAAGLRIVHYGRTGAQLAASSRGVSSMRLPAAEPSDPRSPRACFMQLVVDGVRRYAPSSGGGALPAPDMREFMAERVEAVEFYSGAATTPAEFAGTGASCGTIVIWTRTGP